MRVFALYFVLVFVGVVILFTWKLRLSRRAGKTLASVLALGVVGTFIFVLWKFQPWMPAGQAVYLAGNHLGTYEFQVWQRKNTDTWEPFATGLFARKRGEAWQVFLLDFEDTYRPHIELRTDVLGTVVLHGNKRLGVFDEASQTFKRESDGLSSQGGILAGEPPGDWWLK